MYQFGRAPDLVARPDHFLAHNLIFCICFAEIGSGTDRQPSSVRAGVESEISARKRSKFGFSVFLGSQDAHTKAQAMHS